MPPRLTYYTADALGQFTGTDTAHMDPLHIETITTGTPIINDTTTGGSALRQITGRYADVPLTQLSNVFNDAMFDWLKTSEGYRVLRAIIKEVLEELTTIKTDEKETQEAFDRLLSE